MMTTKTARAAKGTERAKGKRRIPRNLRVFGRLLLLMLAAGLIACAIIVMIGVLSRRLGCVGGEIFVPVLIVVLVALGYKLNAWLREVR